MLDSVDAMRFSQYQHTLKILHFNKRAQMQTLAMGNLREAASKDFTQLLKQQFDGVLEKLGTKLRYSTNDDELPAASPRVVEFCPESAVELIANNPMRENECCEN